MWIVNEAVKDDQPPALYGQFWSQNSYVIAYTYGPPSDPSTIVYFWLGRNSTKNEKVRSSLRESPISKGTCAALALNLAKKRNGATQVRVPQHKETRHFLKIFGGKAIIHRGNQRDEVTAPRCRLYRVKGTDEWNTSTVEVEATAVNLNTNNCFVLLTSDKQSIVWLGKHSSKFAQSIAKEVAGVLLTSPIATIVNEGGETPAFWSALGGKQAYLHKTDTELQGADTHRSTARLLLNFLFSPMLRVW